MDTPKKTTVTIKVYPLFALTASEAAPGQLTLAQVKKYASSKPLRQPEPQKVKAVWSIWHSIAPEGCKPLRGQVSLEWARKHLKPLRRPAPRKTPDEGDQVPPTT